MTRTRLTLAALILIAGVTFADEPRTKPDDATLVTKTYDLRPILGAKSRLNDLTDADAVTRLILDTVPVGELKPDGPRIVERENGLLEIRTTEKNHGDIRDLLDALQRLTDVAVDMRVELIELAAEEAERARLLPLGEGRSSWWSLVRDPVAVIAGVRKTGRLVQVSEGRYGNGVESVVSARRTLVRFPAGPGANATDVKEGYRLTALPVVSADRRFVRFKLTEQSAAVVGVRKRDLGEDMGVPLAATTPVVEEFGRTGTVEVGDGGEMLFRLSYAPRGKAWVVVLAPRIFIREEEELKKFEKK